MKRYRVEFSDESMQDIAKSFEWGCKEWGGAAAVRWYRTLKSKTHDILKQFPLSQPIAPDSDDSDREIRQMIFGRYRILFEVEELTVRILHVRGSFVSEDRDDLGVEE